jgi:L-2-hydroxyglutarate oxidase LhgO
MNLRRLFLENSFNFRSLAWTEVKKYWRKYFISEAKKLVKHINEDKFGKYLKPGIRAQLLDIRTKKLVMDFVVEEAEDSMHVLNSVSPAFTTAFSFAEFVVEKAKRYL